MPTDSIKSVILINDTASVTGGAAMVAIEEAKGLAALGKHVTFFAPCGPVDESLLLAGVYVVCLDQKDVLEDPDRLAAMRRGLWNSKAAQALDALVKDADPTSTILHAHSFSRALSPAFGPIFTGSRVPHVYTMHEYFLACPNGGFYDYQREEICTRKPLGAACLIRNCDSRSRWHKGWRVIRQTALWGPGRLPRGLKHIIYLSQTQLSAIQRHLPEAADLHYLPNPVSFDDSEPRIEAEKNAVFLYVGRLAKEKGCVDLARAAQSANMPVVFVGSGSEEGAIRAANPDAEITGWLPAAEVVAWMRRARALVLPSLWYETFGLVAADALSRGLPVIVGAWNAAAEQVCDQQTGFVYARRDELTTCLQSMTAQRAAECSKQAFAARTEYGLSPTDHVRALMEIYRHAQQEER